MSHDLRPPAPASVPNVEDGPDTWLGVPKLLTSSAKPEACLVQIYPTGPGMGSRFALGDKSQTLGREQDCDVRLNDQSISRHHARIQAGPDGHFVVDLASTNGTFVNDQRVRTAPLRDGNYLGIGNYIFRYLAGGNIESEYHEEIYRLTIIDGLTGIHNKRYLMEFLDRELSRSARHERPLAVILFDLDRFKEVNDRFGHLAGDKTLREVVGCVATAIRKEELFSRYGGEEFVIVLPETTREGALQVAERIRQLVEGYRFNYEGQSFEVTVSLGVAATLGGEAIDPVELIRQADANLYLAKSAGRNRLVG